MSKSVGNVVDPLDYAKQFGPDAFRYFVIREMTVGQDSDFSHELFLSRYNNDLGNDLGNLVSRTHNMLQRYCKNTIPKIAPLESPENDLINLWSKTRDSTLDAYDRLQFHTALEDIFTFIRAINKFLETRAPWKLAKSDQPKDRERLDTVLAVSSEAIRLAATILAPILPIVSQQILEIFQVKAIAWGKQLEWNNEYLFNRSLSADSIILFPRF